MYKIFIGVTAVVGVVLIAGVFIFKKDQGTSTGLSVTASFYPLGDFAKKVGGEYVAVSITTPAGAEPHDFEPTAGDITQVQSAMLFILNGGGVDTWAERLAPDLRKKGVTVVNMSDSIAAKLDAPVEEEGELPYDPHFWLDPVNVEQEVAVIRDALVSVDPDHADAYKTQAEQFLGQLKDLDAAYTAGLANCTTRTFFTSHSAFSYLARRYNLRQFSVTGVSPDSEPSPEQLATLADQARTQKIKYVFFETLVSPKLAQTLAAEVGAQTLVLNPIEGLTADDIKNGKDYLSVMRENLANLQLALDCRS